MDGTAGCRDQPSEKKRTARCQIIGLSGAGKLGSTKEVEWAGWRYLKLAAPLTLLQLRSDALAHVGIGRHRFHDVIELIHLQT
jgi:hypothetical protein